jgi:hypothetical protein
MTRAEALFNILCFLSFQIYKTFFYLVSGFFCIKIILPATMATRIAEIANNIAALPIEAV